jgi:peptide deformylase
MELVYYPDPRLRQVSKRVKDVGEDLKKTIGEMFAIMYKTRGVGLAAPQVGLNIRLVVANIECDPEKKELEEVYINPEIVESSGVQKGEEACLSLPGIVGELGRAKKVKVEFTNLEGKRVTKEAADFQARMFQHEMDHLEGVLIIDRMSRAERLKYAVELKELEQDFKKGVKRKRPLPPAEGGI